MFVRIFWENFASIAISSFPKTEALIADEHVCAPPTTVWENELPNPIGNPVINLPFCLPSMLSSLEESLNSAQSKLTALTVIQS